MSHGHAHGHGHLFPPPPGRDGDTPVGGGADGGDPDTGQNPDGFVPGRWTRPRRTAPAARPTRPPGPGDRRDPRVWVVVVLLVLLQAGAMAALWPHGEDQPLKDRANAYKDGIGFVTGVVVGTRQESCAGDPTDRQADGTVPATTTCFKASVRIDENGRTRVVEVGVPTQITRSGFGVGDELRLTRFPGETGQPADYAYLDFARVTPMVLLTALFLLTVALVGRWRGLLAVVGLLIAYATVVTFVLPALLAGRNPVLVGAVSAGLIMSVILYLVHGLSNKTTTALLGTLAGIWVTAGLAWWISSAAHLNGLVSEENFTLSRLTTGADIRAVILCGMILAGLGILNDVTITQASAVWELRSYAAHLDARQLFTSAMQIGRDHMASTIYTIAFAYAGVALPGLLLVDLYGTPVTQLLTSGGIAEEIARTLVASIGLILAIPLTTAIGVAISHGAADPLGGVANPAASVAAAGHQDAEPALPSRPRARGRRAAL